jgi:hypothetical protein
MSKCARQEIAANLTFECSIVFDAQCRRLRSERVGVAAPFFVDVTNERF